MLGTSTAEKPITIQYNGDLVLDEAMVLLRQWWEETSYQLERLQMNSGLRGRGKRQVSLTARGRAIICPFRPTDALCGTACRSEDKPKVAILRDEGSNSDREMSSRLFQRRIRALGRDHDRPAGSDRINLDGFRGLAAVGGFSYADVPESAKGWAATILFNDRLKRMFHEFYDRTDTFTLGICNGCQLFGLLGWVPWQGIAAEKQPRFIHNLSGRFESRWTTVKVLASPAIMLQGMEDLVFGIHVDHGEGKLHFPDQCHPGAGLGEQMAALVYVDDDGQANRSLPLQPQRFPWRACRTLFARRPPPGDDATSGTDLPPLAGPLAARRHERPAGLALAADVPERLRLVPAITQLKETLRRHTSSPTSIFYAGDRIIFTTDN